LDVPARSSLVTLLSNYACDVGQRGDRRLYCNCDGLVITAGFVVGALIGLTSVVAFAMLVAAGGNPAKGAVGAAMATGFATAMGTMALRRSSHHGRFELDAEQALLRHYRGKRKIGEYSFRDVLRVWLVTDLTDGRVAVQVTLGATPLAGSRAPASWLQIATRSGEMFRLAKGTRQELAPVCEAMRRMGLSLDAPRLD
jgi:hypothetical protein